MTSIKCTKPCLKTIRFFQVALMVTPSVSAVLPVRFLENVADSRESVEDGHAGVCAIAVIGRRVVRCAYQIRISQQTVVKWTAFSLQGYMP